MALEKMSMVEITAGDQKEKIQLINLSTAIDNEVNSGAFDEGNADTWNSGVWYFYLIGGTPIIAALLVSALSLLFSTLKRDN
ncbi:MAG: hypothetical protein GWO23_10140 [Gammaproteobacteria bacterium]|nr:hypothetical protein [Gammaproteobacteria bacterium]